MEDKTCRCLENFRYLLGKKHEGKYLGLSNQNKFMRHAFLFLLNINSNFVKNNNNL